MPSRARLLWTDGHEDLRDVNVTGQELTIDDAEGRPRLFNASDRTDPRGATIWVEESKERERFHVNGRRALVYQHADVSPGRYSAGAPLRGAAEGFTLEIDSLDRAKAIADAASGCPQPCACPPWSD